MVRGDGAQLYTIEGFAAALIMVATAYMVVNATSVYTAGDTHISDMQLETLGSDALTVMGTPVNITVDDTVSPPVVNYNESILQTILRNPGTMNAVFRYEFGRLVNPIGIPGPTRAINFSANYTCSINDGKDSTEPNNLISSSVRELTGTEHPVRVTKWVIVDPTPFKICNRAEKQAVLVEVLLWQD